MRIQVAAKPGAKAEKVERIDRQPALDGRKAEFPAYKVSVKEAPEHGRANDAIARALAGYFHVPVSAVRLLSGQASKNKTFDIGA